MNKILFEEPKLELVIFNEYDIITGSGEIGEDGEVVLPDGDEF